MNSQAVLFRFLQVLVIGLTTLAASACNKDDELVIPPPVVEEEKPLKQYDVPFANVPETSDIVMYEVNLWAFSESGDLEGVRSKLEHLKSLGVNVVWLMPIYEIGQEKGIGSPYAVKNYTQINTAFGDLEDLRLLVKEAHAKDMAVILDWVANHTAWDNAWIENESWYTKDASGNIISPAGMGWNDVADLNFGSQAMRKEMIEAMKYWVLEANVDGYRCDYAVGVPADFWKQAIDTLRNIPGREILMFAEAEDKKLFNSGFDLIFGWHFYSALKDVFNTESASTLAGAHSTDYTGVPEGSHILRWTTNHDDNAWDDTPINIFKGLDGSVAAFVVTSYMGGVPLLYTGQEVGFSTQLQFFQNASTKVNWETNPDVLDEYKKVLTFRNESEAVKKGDVQSYSAQDVAAFKRTFENEEVLVIVSVRDKGIDYSIPAALQNTAWTNVMTNESVTLETAMSLESYEYIILKNN